MQKSSSNPIPARKITLSPVMAALMLIVIAYGGSQYVSAQEKSARYPINIEYQLMQQCMAGQMGTLASGSFQDQQAQCVCTVETTIDQVDLNRFNVNPEGFYRQMEKNLRICR